MHDMDDIIEMAEELGPNRPDVAPYVERAYHNPAIRPMVRGKFQRMRRKERISPTDPWLPHARTAQLGTEGLILGRARNGILRWCEYEYSLIAGGSPGYGKSSLIINLVFQLAMLGLGVLIFDVRGDYSWLPALIPSALLIPWEKNRDNILTPLDQRTGLQTYLKMLGTYLPESFSLMDASIGYTTQRLLEFADRCRGAGCSPDVIGFWVYLRSHRPSSPVVQQYHDRVCEKFAAIVQWCGEPFLAVQRGFDIKRLLDQGRIVIYQMTAPKAISDFYVGLQLLRLYLSRVHAEEPFAQPPLFVVLDEQRSVLRQREGARIYDIDRLITLSRKMNLCYLIGEQIISQLSRAVKISCRCRIAFNVQSGDELRSTAEMMGFTTRDQQLALRELPPGQAVVSIGGDRCPAPQLIRIPKLHEIQALTTQRGL